jgi:hypothetical protein
MEGVIKVISGTIIGVVAVSAIGFTAIQLHSIYYGGVTYTKSSNTLDFTDLKGKRLPWTKEVHLFTMHKGPGKDFMLRDMRNLVNEDAENAPTAICTQCGAWQDQIIFRK